MKNLFVSDVFLALEDLLQTQTENPRLALFEGTLTGKLYRSILQAHLESLRALPPELLGGRPLAEEMSQLDVLHDGFGGTFIEIAEGYLRMPTLSKERREQLTLLLREFARGGLSELKASYPDEASAAKERQPKLAQYETLLKEFPLVDGGSFYDLVKGQIESGVALDQKMSERAKVEAGAGRAGSSKLRSVILGTLGRCRASLSDEVAARPELPRNLDAQLFGYLDELDVKRASHNQERRSKPAEPTETK